MTPPHCLAHTHKSSQSTAESIQTRWSRVPHTPARLQVSGRATERDRQTDREDVHPQSLSLPLGRWRRHAGRRARTALPGASAAGPADDAVQHGWGEVIAGRTELLGPHARETLDAQWYLAMMLMDDSGEWSRSRRVWGAVASGYASAYGQCHTNTQAARCCVCCCCMCVPFACCCGRRKRRGAGGLDSDSLLEGGGSSGPALMSAAP
jgi:hypothetical protein